MYTNQSKKQGQMLHVTKPHRDRRKINTEMYANISTEEHNEGALKHEPNFLRILWKDLNIQMYIQIMYLLLIIKNDDKTSNKSVTIYK